MVAYASTCLHMSDLCASVHRQLSGLALRYRVNVELAPCYRVPRYRIPRYLVLAPRSKIMRI